MLLLLALMVLLCPPFVLLKLGTSPLLHFISLEHFLTTIDNIFCEVNSLFLFLFYKKNSFFFLIFFLVPSLIFFMLVCVGIFIK